MAKGKTWCTNGIKNILGTFFKTSDNSEDLELFLFSNNYTPSVDCIEQDLIEITENGLEKVELSKELFSDPVLSGLNVELVYNSEIGIEYSITGTQSVYGYAIRGKTSKNIYFVENFGLKLLESGDFTFQPVKIKIKLS